MNLKNIKLLEDNKLWDVALTESGTALIFTWKLTPIVTDEDYKNAIRTIAKYSLEQKPHLVLVDKRKNRHNAKFDHAWWQSEILPQYHKAGFSGFAHITGNSAANGQYPNAPEGLNFKMGEFNDIESALKWDV